MREETPHSPVQILLVVIVLAYAGLLIIAPIAAIANGAIDRGWQPIQDTLTDPVVQHALTLTAKLSFAATLINVVAGLVIAWVLVRDNFYGKRFVNALVDIPFVFSPVIAGYTLIVLFGRGGWLESDKLSIVFSWRGMLIAQTFVVLPFIAREVAPVLESLPREPEEAAYTLGASRWGTFWRVVMPGIWTGLLYGVVLTLARALGEFGAVAVVSGGIEGKTESATMFVFRALHDRNKIGSYTVSLLLGLVCMVILITMSLIKYQMRKREERLSHVYRDE